MAEALFKFQIKEKVVLLGLPYRVVGRELNLQTKKMRYFLLREGANEMDPTARRAVSEAALLKCNPRNSKS